ncbi:zinc finger protein 547-like isoform X2 [Erpetoichthys calabaricus]|uniref:zinc finger protein 547-like isoform X2 n=1 Tax=Erpetoichthys calabaricus TaxID=27687 RepID=UPI002234078A|nr:zinc finger protein 547-like isoform X2 [Erpetoichthys calabaricus]
MVYIVTSCKATETEATHEGKGGCANSFRKNPIIERQNRGEETVAIYCNIEMNMKEEMHEAVINSTEKMTVSIKKEECDGESVHPNQESLCIKEEDYELVTVDIKEEAEETSVRFEMPKPASMECTDLKVGSESLLSETKMADEMSSVRTWEDQPTPSNWATITLQDNGRFFLSLPHTSLHYKAQQIADDENMKKVTSESEGVVIPASLQDNSLLFMKLTTVGVINTQPEMHITKDSATVHQEQRKSSESEPKSKNDRQSQAQQKMFQCSECGKRFTRISHLHNHTRIHTGEKPYCCSECGRRFITSSSLQYHRRTHTGEKPFCCPECGKQFITSSKFQYHKRTHTGEKPYCCSECGKRFTTSSYLQIHAQIHNGEKPYCCAECGTGFMCKSSLQKHRRIHTGEKPYSCFECGKLFSYKSTLQTHIMIHTGEKPFCCFECGKGFTFKSCLQKHGRVHTKGKR